MYQLLGQTFQSTEAVTENEKMEKAERKPYSLARDIPSKSSEGKDLGSEFGYATLPLDHCEGEQPPG